MAGVTLHPLQWVLAIFLVAVTPVLSAPYLKTAPGHVGAQQPPLDHLFSPDQGLIGPLFRQNDYSIDPPAMGGCYYQFRHYEEGDRIITNEPCLNCTCHNSMLMCYLKVCPFSKPIGQDCTIEKDLNQCCPVITCPQVPVNLQVMPMTSLTTTKSPVSTAVVPYTKHGCTIAEEFYPDGAQVPGDPKNPCELCYCIRNHTACLMQECILKVEGCKPVFEDGICCPVRYMCEYEDEELLQITTTLSPVNETILTTTLPPHIGGCTHDFEFYADGALIPSEDPCEHCYCMKNDIVCAIQECRSPLDEDDENCTPRLPLPGKCCPEAYDCPSTDETTIISGEVTTDAYSPFGIETVIETEKPAIEDKEVIHVDPVEQTTLEYVTAEIVTVTKRPVLLTTDKATLPEEAIVETTEEEKVTVKEITELPTIIEEATRMTTAAPEVIDKEIEEGLVDITKSTGSDSDLLETRTTGPDEEMFLTTTPMSDETTFEPVTDDVKEKTVPTVSVVKPDDKLPEPTPQPIEVIETDVDFDADATPEEIISPDTTLSPIDSIETTSAKEELIEDSLQTTTIEKLKPIDVTTEAVTLSEHAATEEVEAATDAPKKEILIESTTLDTEPIISESTTLPPEASIETTSPEQDLSEISIDATITEKLTEVEITSEAATSPESIVTDSVGVETITEIADDLETTTTVTGDIDPNIQPSVTQKPVVAPIDGQCLSNGTIYEEGDLVTIVNICQENCICSSGIITCQQIACPSPPPAFLRCDAQKNPKECCPQYECPLIQPDPVPSPNCNSNGQQYLEGEFIPSPDSCTDCYCLYGEMICAYQECPEVEPGCKPLEIPEGACCPAKYECPILEILDLTITTVPSVEVAEVAETTLAPKELPELELDLTEPTDVVELDVATTPSEIPDKHTTEKPVEEISTIIPDITKLIEEVTPEVTTEKVLTALPAETTHVPDAITPEPEITTVDDAVIPEEYELTTIDSEFDVEMTTAAVPEEIAEITISVEDSEPPTTTPSEEISTPTVEDETTSMLEVTTKSIVSLPLGITDGLETTPVEILVDKATIKPVEAVTDPSLVFIDEIQEDGEDLEISTEPFTSPVFETTKKDDVITTESTIEYTTIEHETEKIPSEFPAETFLPEEVTDAELQTTTELPGDREIEVAATTQSTEEASEIPADITTTYEELTDYITTPIDVDVTVDVDMTTIIPDIEETTILDDLEEVIDTEAPPVEAVAQLVDSQTETSVSDITTVISVEYSPSTDLSTESLEVATTEIFVDAQEPVTDSVLEVSTDVVTDKPATSAPEYLTSIGLVVETTDIPVEAHTVTQEIIDEHTTELPIIEISTITEATKTVETATKEIITDYIPPSSMKPESDIGTTLAPIFEGCWWFDNNLYEHSDAVPSENICQENCTCTNGTVRCQHKACPPAPPAFLRCTESSTNDSCCPTFECAPSPTDLKCQHNGQVFDDNEYIPSDTLCQDCFCLSGDVVCAELVCGVPRMNCEAIAQMENECCPSTYECMETTTPDVTTETATTPLLEVEAKLPEVVTIDKVDEVTTTTLATVEIYDKTTDLPKLVSEIEVVPDLPDKPLDIEDDQPEAPGDDIKEHIEVSTTSPFISETEHFVDTTETVDRTTVALEEIVAITSVETEPVDATTESVILPEHTTTEEVKTVTDFTKEEILIESTTLDVKPAISESTTLPPVVLVETTSPEEDLTEISIETTTTEKLAEVEITSEVATSPEPIVTDSVDIETITEIADVLETTTTLAIESVTGDIDPKIQPSVTQKPEVIPTDGQCLSNGTIYNEGDIVPIVNACQENCICSSGIVTCQQIACPSPPPAFLRCDAQKNPKECCPQYECPIIQPDPVPSPNCISKGQQYLEGEFIPSPDSCTDCYCLYGEIICAYQECPEVEPGCKPLEIPEGTCCPAKYECPAMEILDLTLTTVPSVEVAEVAETTLAPKELPELELDKTEPTDVVELDIATTPSEITDDHTTEKPVDEISTIIPEVVKVTEEVKPEVTTEKILTALSAETTIASDVITPEPEIATDIGTVIPEEYELTTTESAFDVEMITAAVPEEIVETIISVDDSDPSTATPSDVEDETTSMLEITTKSTVFLPLEVTDGLETTPVEVLVDKTTLKPVEAVTDPSLVFIDEIQEDGEDMKISTESITSQIFETTKKDVAITTEASKEYTTLEHETEKISFEMPTETVLSVDILTTTELSVDAEVEATTAALLEADVLDSTTVFEETDDVVLTTETAISITGKPDETTTDILLDVQTEKAIEVTTTVSKVTEDELLTTEDAISATEKPDEHVTDTLLDVQTDKTVVVATTVSDVTEDEVPSTEVAISATKKPEEAAIDTLVDVQTDKTIEETTMAFIVTEDELLTTEAAISATEKPDEPTTDTLLDVQTDKVVEAAAVTTATTDGETITVDAHTTISPEEDTKLATESDTVAEIGTTEMPAEIITTPVSVVQTEKSTDLPIEIVTTAFVAPDIAEITDAPVTDSEIGLETTIIPYFEGCWWFDNKLYEHGESVPSDNSCQENCRCINGTVRCQYKACPPTPPSFLHCKETFNNDSCCTSYDCTPLPTNLQCMHNGKIYSDGDFIPSDTLCFDCYCVEGEVICADLVCGIPRNDCDAIMQRANECCPTTYECKEMIVPDLLMTTTTVAELEPTIVVDDVIEPKIKNVTIAEPVEITPSPDVVTHGIEADEETLPEIPEKVPEIITDAQYIPPTTVSPNETTTWTPTTTTELVIGPGSCLFNGKVYVSAQQIPRDDPCDFCFCFRGDIICLQQTCPPPIPGCYEEAISGFCCPRYECPVKQSVIEITTTTTPFPSFPPQYKTSRETVCEVDGIHYPVGQVIPEASSPCHECICGKDGFMKCLPKECDSHRKLTIHGYR